MGNSGIQKELLRSHLGVACISLVIITVLVNTILFVTFGGYVRNQQKEELQIIVQELSEAFTAQEGWPASVLMSLSHRSMLRNMVVRITDVNDNLIWDSMTIGHMHSLESLAPNAGESFQWSVKTPIQKEGVTIGYVSIGATASIFQGQEKDFLFRMNAWIWLAFLFVMFAIYWFSKRVSMRISNPLLIIKETADRMTEGCLKSRVNLKAGQSEIRELGDALNHLAERLQKHELLRKNMTADIAHELRTPVAVIRSYIEAFQDAIWEPTPEKMQICYQQVMQLTLMIQDLENLSEAENPMLILDKAELNLVTVIQEAQKAVQEIAGDKHIQYIAPEPKDIPFIGDYRRLMQVFVNLISNAYKYTPVGGTVRISADSNSKHILVQVQDTGTGIRSEEIPFIFERFYRGEKSRNRKLGGAGIGLAVVKALVEVHEGTITVENNTPLGTIFTIKFPYPNG